MCLLFCEEFMKNFICVISLMLVFVLSACTTVYDVDLSVVMNDINSSFDASSLTVIETKGELEQYYLIKSEDVESFEAEFSTDSTDMIEIVLVKAVDEEALENISKSLNNLYISRMSLAQSYDPKTVSMLEKCSVEKNGLYVSLIISDNVDELREIYNSYFQ